MTEIRLQLENEQATVSLGGQLAKACQQSVVIFLHGELGAGKTTLSRGFVQGMGHTGRVKSPTYALVEPYQLGEWSVSHFDLYRLCDPEELEYMGIRDYFADNSLCLIEWPEKGKGMLPEPDLELWLAYQGEQRVVRIQGHTEVGKAIVRAVGSSEH